VSVQRAALRMVDRAAGTAGILRGWLDPDALMHRASRRTGLDDFGTDTLHEPLQRFPSACTAEADLNIVGHFATRWDTLRLLTNLLRLRAEEIAAPDIIKEQIEKPIFITGMPRSGTSFLHDLMLCDRGARAPRVWQTIYPYPIGRGRDARLDRVRRQIRAFGRLAPEFQARHPIDALSPQECTEITAHVFRSLRFDTTYWVPSYREWLDATGHLEAYRFHKRFLQHLQRQDGPGQWVLKSPDHVFALEAIRDVYPDARVISCTAIPLMCSPRTRG
jgi:Sulfotransferase family